MDDKYSLKTSPVLQRVNTNGVSGGSIRDSNGRNVGEDSNSWAEEPIAIIGLGCRLPGGINSPSKLWETLIQGKSTQSTIPKSRFNLEGFYHSDPERPGSIPTMGGYFLSEDLRTFDNEFFGINNLEAKYMDPEQRKLLEVVYECFESSGAGLEAVSGANIGCYVGKFTYDYLTIQNKDPEYLHRYSATGMSTSILANRVSHVFNLHGPSLVVDTACSSAMYGLHMACNALRVDDCDSAIVAGANLIQSPEQHIATMKAGVLSASSACHTFDVTADGYGRGESIGAIHIKRLSAALRDGDPIRSVIRGTAVNSNGKSQGITLPVADYQESVIRKAYARASLRPEETDYVECHGTGTAVGDPIEVEALSRAFLPRQEHPLLIGSVKPNVGHSEAASAITSIIKVTLALENGIIPATFGVRRLNPNLKAPEKHVEVVTENRFWPVREPLTSRRASVNSFGFGGANAHVVLEAAKEYVIAADRSTDRALALGRTRFLLPFSAGNDSSLEHRVQDLKLLCQQRLNVVDLAYSLGERRSRLDKKGFLLASQQSLLDDLQVQNLRTSTALNTLPTNLPITFVFTGQGAQWPQMGQDLIQEFPSFRHSIQKLDATLQFLPDPPTWTIHGVLQETDGDSVINQAAYSQTICTAIQIAILQLLDEWGLRPEYVVGHSSGEICAAYAAGFVTAEEAIITAYIRGRTCSKLTQKGAMLATGLSRHDAAQTIEDLSMSNEVCVACINSPENVTISGNADEIARLYNHFQAKDVFARALRTDGRAYHSHHMATIGQEYSETVAEATKSYPSSTRTLYQTPQWISTVTGEIIDSNIDHDYWRCNLESPVRFSDAISTLLANSGTHFIEIGPHAVLELPIRQTVSSLKIGAGKILYSPTLLRQTSGVECLLQLMGNLYLHNHDVDFASVNHVDVLSARSGDNRQQGKHISNLPNYQWNHDQIFWTESRQSEEFRNRTYPRHDILGSRVHGISNAVAVWRNFLSVRNVPWLNDHRIDRQIVFPAAGYVAMVIEAASQQKDIDVGSLPSCYFKDVVVSKALVVSDEDSSDGVEIQTLMFPTGSSSGKGAETSWKFSITSLVGNDTITHASGEVGFDSGNRVMEGGTSSVDNNLVSDSPRLWYDRLSQAGLNFSGDFESLTEVRNSRSKDTRVTVAVTPLKVGGGPDGQSTYALHPSTIDGILHTALIATAAGVLKDLRLRIPTSIRYMRIDLPSLQGLVEPLTVHGSAEPVGFDSMKTAVFVRSSKQGSLMEVKDCRLTVPFQEMPAMIPERHPMLRVTWKPDISMISQSNSVAFSGYLSSCANSMSLSDNINIPGGMLTALDLLVHKDPGLRILILQDFMADITPLARFLQMNTDFKRCKILARGSQSDTEGLFTEQMVSMTEEGCEYGSSTAVKHSAWDIVLYCQKNQRGPLSSRVRTVEPLLTTNGTILGYFHADAVAALEKEGLSVTHLRGTQCEDLTIARRKPAALNTKSNDNRRIDLDDKEIILVDRNPRHPLNKLLAENFAERFGHSFRRVDFDRADLQALKTTSTIISTLELEEPILPAITDVELDLIRLLTNKSSSLIWVTGGGLLYGSRPDFALSFGISRSIMLEQPALKFFSFDVDDPFNHPDVATRNILHILDQALVDIASDFEFMQDRRGIPHISRFEPERSLNANFRQKQGLEAVPKPLEEVKPCKVVLQETQNIQAGHFEQVSYSHNELEPGYVEIETMTIHLDSALSDVLLGTVETENSLGLLQILGEVKRVGKDVQSISLGDKVLCLTPSHISSTVIASELFCIRLNEDEYPGLKIPMMAATCTVLYALRRCDNLSIGSKVLISSVTNHVGATAIQVVRERGADVYAIVANSQEREVMNETLAIRKDHIFDVSDPAFVSKALIATEHMGFDLFLHANKEVVSEAVLETCADFACVVEARQQTQDDFVAPRRVSPGRGISYTNFAIHDLFKSSNHKQVLQAASLLNESMNLFREGHVRLIQPERHFNMGEIPHALEHLRTGHESEKIVLTFQDPDTIVMASPSKYETNFSPDKYYFLVGCLGGLGRGLTKWMLSRGARKFLFLGRSGLTRQVAKDFVHELESQGAEVRVVQGDVSRLEDVENAVSACSAPLGGVVQAAMGLDESLFASISQEQWNTAMAPKVAGTWNIHNAICGKDSQLDFFLMTSSISGSVGVATESNYCASNYFLDVFARYRLSQGLPATSVGLGMISQIGYLHEHPDVQNGLILKGVSPIDADDFLQIIDIALSSSTNRTCTDDELYDCLSKGHILTGLEPLGLNELRKKGFEGTPATFDDPRAALLSGVFGGSNRSDRGSGTGAWSAGLPSEVIAACENNDPSSIAEAVLPLISKQLSNFLLTPVEKLDTSRPLAGFGMDSVLAAAVRTWFYRKFQVDLPFLTLLSQSISIRDLAQTVAEQIGQVRVTEGK